MVIVLAFVNPIISFGLLVLYYLPSIIKSACDDCKEKTSDKDKDGYFQVNIPFTLTIKKPGSDTNDFDKMKTYRDDTLEEMK